MNAHMRWLLRTYAEALFAKVERMLERGEDTTCSGEVDFVRVQGENCGFPQSALLSLLLSAEKTEALANLSRRWGFASKKSHS